MTESLLEKLNKGIRSDIRYTQNELRVLETMGVDDIDDIDRIGFVETLQNLGRSLLGYIVGKPTETVEPVVENAVVALSDFEKGLEHEIESIETGRDAVEYARRAIVRSRLKKRVEHAKQFSANQLEYIASSTETVVEPFLDKVEQPLAGAGTAIADYAASETSIAAKHLVESVGETAVGALETIKNIPSNISNYAKDMVDHLPDISSFSSQFWSWVETASDFFYIACALILLGKFDFLLKNTYLVALVAIVIVYTLYKT